MQRALTILFRRDPSRDRQQGSVRYEGYQILWPDGQPVSLGLNAFCQHGQRLLGLGRFLAGRRERLIDILFVPLASLEDHLTRLPGYRVRRFFLQRHGCSGRIHFMDGTATEAIFDLGHDDARVLQWLGLASLHDGAQQWFDLAACPREEWEGTTAVPKCVSAGCG